MSTSGWTIEHSQHIEAPVDKVFAALTDVKSLTAWFAEHAEISVKVGDPWRFWGMHSLGTPRSANASDALLALEPGKSLRYSSMVGEIATEVTLSVAEGKDWQGNLGTKATVKQAGMRMLPDTRPLELVEDFWRLALGNLRAFVTGGDEIVRPDLADPKPEIRVTATIAAPPAKVFRALLEPEALKVWLGANASVDPKAGGTYRYGWKYKVNGKDVEGGPTRILELVPDKRLVSDWPDWRGDDTVTGQKVTWTLEPAGADTRVTMVHAGFGRAADFGDYPFGWQGFVQSLKAYVEGA